MSETRSFMSDVRHRAKTRQQHTPANYNSIQLPPAATTSLILAGGRGSSIRLLSEQQSESNAVMKSIEYAPPRLHYYCAVPNGRTGQKASRPLALLQARPLTL